MLSGDGADFLGIVIVAGGIFAVWERGCQQTFKNCTCSGHGCPLDMSISSVGPLLDSRLLRAKPQQWMWVIFPGKARQKYTYPVRGPCSKHCWTAAAQHCSMKCMYRIGLKSNPPAFVYSSGSALSVYRHRPKKEHHCKRSLLENRAP